MTTENPEVKHYNPKFRRRHKYQGATWTPKNHSAALGDGAWCRPCMKRHGYMTMEFNVTKNGDGKWVILWGCPVTHNVIQEDVLGEKYGQDGGTTEVTSNLGGTSSEGLG